MQSELEPVRAAAKLFREYAQMHADKYEPFGQSEQEHAAITAKVERNADAAQSLEDWLNAQPTPPAVSAGLVERLRAVDISWSETGELCAEAAHHIAAQDAEIARLREALVVADTAIKETFRYYDGGETRGSYDGKPERNQLRKAGYATTAALKGTDHGQ